MSSDQVQIPNCNDPVFRAWCQACDLSPGAWVDARDVRIAMLEQFMQALDRTYDPEQDTADDYLTRGL